MTCISASEFLKAFGLMSDKALVESVTITKQGRDRLVVLSAADYAPLKRRDRAVGRAEDLPDALLDETDRSRMDARHIP